MAVISKIMKQFVRNLTGAFEVILVFASFVLVLFNLAERAAQQSHDRLHQQQHHQQTQHQDLIQPTLRSRGRLATEWPKECTERL